MTRRVLAFLHCFPLAALLEQRARPWLRGRPVGVVSGAGNHVVSVSPEAGRGAHSRLDRAICRGAPAATASSRTPRLVMVRESPSVHDWGIAVVQEVVNGLSRRVAQQPSGFLLAPLPSWPPAVWAQTLEDELARRLGFGLPLGLSTAGFVAALAATRCAPGQFHCVQPGDEPDFLSPLPLEALPALRGGRGRLLRQMGLSTVADVAQLPLHALTAGVGNAGRRVYMEARGLDPAGRGDSGSGVWMSRRFSPPTNSLRVMERELIVLIGKALSSMDRRSEKPTSLRLILFTSDRRREEATQRVHPRVTAEGDILCAARKLLARLGRRRVAIEEVVVGFERPTRLEQTELLWGRELRAARVGKAIRTVRHRFGDGALQRANLLSTPSRQQASRQ